MEDTLKVWWRSDMIKKRNEDQSWFLNILIKNIGHGSYSPEWHNFKAGQKNKTFRGLTCGSLNNWYRFSKSYQIFSHAKNQLFCFLHIFYPTLEPSRSLQMNPNQRPSRNFMRHFWQQSLSQNDLLFPSLNFGMSKNPCPFLRNKEKENMDDKKPFSFPKQIFPFCNMSTNVKTE